MKNLLTSALALFVLSGSLAYAEEFATAKDAESMVAKAVQAISADQAGTFKEITAKDPNSIT